MEGISAAMVTRDAGFLVDELPPGFRFHPTDGEVIDHYLKKKVLQRNFNPRAIGEVDLNKCEPWDLPSKAKMGENEWYFYYKKDRKSPTGLRTNRATKAGYWKATGKDKPIYKGKCNLIGMKKTLVFYKGRAPRGEKSNWVMHEFRLQSGKSTHTPNISQNQKPEWVVCRISHKNTDTIVKKPDSLTMIKKSTAASTTITSPSSPSPSPSPSTMGYNFDNTVLPQMVDISSSYPTININNCSDAYNSGCVDYSMPFCSAADLHNIQNQQYPNTTLFTTPYCNNLSFTNPQLTDIDISSPAQYFGTPTEIKSQPTVLPPISSTSTNNLMVVKQYMEEEEEKDVFLCFNDLSSLISYPEMEIVSPENLLNYVESNNKWPGEIG